MDSARWERIQELFHEAVDLPPGDREPFVRARCAGDPELATEVLEALEEDARGTSLLDEGVGHAASRLFDADPAAVTDASTLREIGPYRVIRVLGEGGVGTVLLAERTDLGSRVAIKVLRDAWLSPARRERFAAEQRLLAGLNDNAIARLYDAGTLPDGTPWIVMEYVEGTSLTDYCRSRRSAVAERVRLFRAVCAAVQYAHRHLVIHRDLKPSNIFVTADGGVKLLDFGIAKQLEGIEVPVEQTRGGVPLMTPAYAAPEQIRGEQVGVHTDVYSLGVILYELLADRRPFDLEGRTPREAATAVLEQQPAPPVSPRAPGDLDVLCLTAMHKDPARRYQTVEALIRDLDHFTKGEPLEARPDAVSYRARKFVTRHWRGLAVAGAAAVVIVGVVLFYTVRLTAARNAALLEAERTTRIQRLMLNLFTGGDVAAGPAADLRVLTLLDRGVQEAENLRAEPGVRTEMFATLGSIYQKLGEFAKADTLLTRTRDERRAQAGTESADAGVATVALGLLRSEEAQYEEAERLVRDGLALITRTTPAGDVRVARATTALGQVLIERGQYPAAIAVLQDAVRLHSVHGAVSADVATAQRQLVNAHFYAGNWDAADAIARQALATTKKVNGTRHPLVAEDLINLGAVQFERGRYAEAEALYREALTLTEAWFGREHHQTASNLTMLGRALVYQKRFDEAVVELRRALAIQERVFGASHPRVASVLNDLGNVAIQSARLEEAEAAFTRVGGIYRQVYGGKHYLVATATSNLGGVYVARKDYRRAEALYRDAIAMYSETQSPTHLNTGIARLKLGRALLRDRRYPEAEASILAGMEIVAKQTSPAVSWLRAGREDLVALYDATNRPQQAAVRRAELAAAREGQP